MTDFEGFQKLKQYVSLKGEELERIKALQKVNFVVKDLSAIEEVSEDSDYEGEDVLFGKRELASLYITFIMATMNKGIDILILLDCTGSMSAQIEMSKNTILQTIDFVKKRYPKSTSRFGFIGYRDFEDGPQRMVKMDFTNDFNAVKDFISKQSAFGGGDEAEDIIGALEVAQDFKFEETNITNIILINDATCHGSQYHDPSIKIGDNHKDEVPDGHLEELMMNLSKKSEVIKFGALKLNKRSDFMLEIMKKNFGAKKFSIMGEREMKTI